MRDEPEIVRAVLATLVRIVAADDAELTVRSYEPERRSLDLVLSDGDPATVWEFLADVLRRHGIWLDDVRIETGGAGRRTVPGSPCASHVVRVRRG